MSESLAHIVGGLGFSIVYFKISLFHHRCGAVFKDLVDHTKFGKPTTFDARARRCRLLASFLFLYCTAGVPVYLMLLSYENRDSICQRTQKTTDQNLYCGLLYPLWLPGNISRPVLMVIQTIVTITVYAPGGQVCLLIYESTFILISHIEFLLEHLDKAFRETNVKRRYWMLRYCVEYHMQITKMGKDICSLHETFTGHLAVVWAVSYGCICNEILHSKLIAVFMYLFGYIVTCCCLCEAGQALLTKSEAIAEKLYKIPWHVGNVQEQKCIMFMIARAQTPMRLTATPFGNYDCSFFIMIIKTAYSYLTLLQNSMRA